MQCRYDLYEAWLSLLTKKLPLVFNNGKPFGFEAFVDTPISII